MAASWPISANSLRESKPLEHLALKIYSKGGILLTACAPERVSAVYCAAYRPGDMISLEIGETNRFCVVQFEDTMPPALVYVKQQRIVFPVPVSDKPEPIPYSPKSFAGSCHIIRARFATPEEISTRRNLAFNPYDHMFYGQGPMGDGKDTGFYPHASSNIEPTSPGFAPRTAIDGVLENGAHLMWPYQAWSNDRDPSAELTIDFGRAVCIDELRLTLRADYPHDSWWTEGTALFSDGSSKTVALEKTALPQVFSITPRTVTSLTLCNLKKHEDVSLYTALTQIEVWGTETEIK